MNSTPTQARPELAEIVDTTAGHTARVDLTYRTEAVRLRSSMARHTRDSDLADEVVAEAFTQLLRRGAAVRDPAAWVWRSAFRIANGEMQRRRTRATVPIDSVREPGCGAEIDLVELADVLAQLSPMQRTVLTLFECDGWSGADIAVMVGSTGQAVRVHALRARRRVAASLREAS